MHSQTLNNLRGNLKKKVCQDIRRVLEDSSILKERDQIIHSITEEQGVDAAWQWILDNPR